jgi:hypothetical protein
LFILVSHGTVYHTYRGLGRDKLPVCHMGVPCTIPIGLRVFMRADEPTV